MKLHFGEKVYSSTQVHLNFFNVGYDNVSRCKPYCDKVILVIQVHLEGAVCEFVIGAVSASILMRRTLALSQKPFINPET